MGTTSGDIENLKNPVYGYEFLFRCFAIFNLLKEKYYSGK